MTVPRRRIQTARQTPPPIFQQISEEVFVEQFAPIENHFDPDSHFNRCMFSVFGEEHDFVCRQDPRTIWTLVADDNESHYQRLPLCQ